MSLWWRARHGATAANIGKTRSVWPRGGGAQGDGKKITQFIRSRPANQTKKRAKTKSSWISPIFVNSGVFPEENKYDSHWTFVPECPCERFMNWPFFGLVCWGHSSSKFTNWPPKVADKWQSGCQKVTEWEEVSCDPDGLPEDRFWAFGTK